MDWLYRFLLVCVLFGSPSIGLAFRVQGSLRDAPTRLPVRGAVVSMERPDADEHFSTDEPVDEKGNRWRGRATMALFVFIFEGRNRSENTLEVWGLLGKGAMVGLLLALVAA